MPTESIIDLPLVSVVMCTFNGEQFIIDQLDSICRQTYPNIEIIICDDVSTDGTYKLLEQYAAIEGRITLYRNEVNLGYTANFSKTCTYVQGKYIAISDQDDVWHPQKIQRLIEHWVPGVPLMYCNSVRFNGNKIPWDAGQNKLYRRFEGDDARKLAIFNTVSGHALIATTVFLKSILPFPKLLMYDWWSAMVAACAGGVGYVPDILVFQRVHGKNQSVGHGFDHKDRKYKPLFNTMVDNHLAAFLNAPETEGPHRSFYKTLSPLWSDSLNRKFSFRLFWFLLKNRTIIFWYKQKKFGLISHLKHSYLLSRN